MTVCRGVVCPLSFLLRNGLTHRRDTGSIQLDANSVRGVTMDISRDIDSLTHFKRNSSELIEQLKSTGAPMVLTVNGKAEVVVQDAASYQRLAEIVDRAEAVLGIRRGLESMRAGEGIPADEAFAQLIRKHKIGGGE